MSLVVGNVAVTINADAFMAKLRKRIEAGMAAAANDLKDRIKKRLAISNQRGLFPAEPGESPHRGNGDLIRSMFAERVTPLTWHIGTRGVPYGALQEYGGWIGIRNKQWLTIPRSKEAMRHRTKKGTALEFPKKLHFVPTSKRNLAFLVERRGNKEIIHYELRKSVFIPAHPYLRPAMHDPEFHRRALELLGGSAESVASST